ncbi:MAG: glycosyltransferase family 2 protein [Candidatus Ratteibacteria bacterium]|nr:glycosyltransferase family 2 protein [Candidatus Ratteibacteria bacterium]
MKLSIIMPVYNEKNTVSQTIDEVFNVNLGDIEKELIVVDDGSDDGTQEVLDGLKSKKELKLLRHDSNRGKGAAIRTALAHVTGELVVIQDADLEYDPREYPSLLKPILEDRADVVYGTRFFGAHKVLLFWHFMGNLMLNFVANFLYNVNLSDFETCFKLFKSEILKSFELKSRGFEFETEVTAKTFKKRYRLWEVPISYAGRGYEEGKKIRPKDGIIALFCLFKHRFFD